MPPPPLWLDVTETLASGRRTGIQRVTIELARELLRCDRGDLIRFDAKAGTFRVLSNEERDRLFSDQVARVGLTLWQSWASRWRLVPLLGLIKDSWLLVNSWRPQHQSFDWQGGVYLTAEVLGNLARYRAVRRLQGKTETVFVLHDLFPLTFPLYTALRRRAFARHWNLALAATRLVAVSTYTAREAANQAAAEGFRLPPIAVSHPGHSVSLRSELPPQPLPPEPYFLCVGTLEHRKNQDGLLEAYAHYRARGGKTALALVGAPGPGTSPLVAKVRQARELGVVWYEGVSDPILTWLYRRARALVYPSRAEGFGLPVIEALAFGLPCLTSDRTATAESAEQYGGCHVVDPNDTMSLSTALDHLDDESVRTNLANSIQSSDLPTWPKFFSGVERACRG